MHEASQHWCICGFGPSEHVVGGPPSGEGPEGAGNRQNSEKPAPPSGWKLSDDAQHDFPRICRRNSENRHFASFDRFDCGQNFPMLAQLLGPGKEPAASTHADGYEVSLMLHYHPDMVRPGYRQLPEAPSSRFFEAIATGDATKNPTGMGGFPFDKASAEVGKKIADYRTHQIGDTIKSLTKSTQPHN